MNMTHQADKPGSVTHLTSPMAMHFTSEELSKKLTYVIPGAGRKPHVVSIS